MAGPSSIFTALWVTALKIERDYITARRRDQPSHIILKLKTPNNYNNAGLTPLFLPAGAGDHHPHRAEAGT
jgi:hypothetical protein